MSLWEKTSSMSTRTILLLDGIVALILVGLAVSAQHC